MSEKDYVSFKQNKSTQQQDKKNNIILSNNSMKINKNENYFGSLKNVVAKKDSSQVFNFNNKY